jgi:membrane peptidoglycan carboxypeptidase
VWRWASSVALFCVGFLGFTFGALAYYEITTSTWQGRLASAYAAKLGYALKPEPSAQPLPAPGGPFDIGRGYTRLPEFTSRLAAAGMRVTQQANPSPDLARLVEWGISPPHREPPVAGLIVRGADGRVLFDGRRGTEYFAGYDEVPPLLARTLTYIENRELLDDDPRHNPAIEWDRQAKAALMYAGSQIGIPVHVEGGSTLATQLEKFRHSPRGRTGSSRDKLRQIVSATLKAYRHGADTTLSRREILVDYLNSIPLAAAPRWGEVHGLGDGLRAWFGLSLADVRRALSDPANTPKKVSAYKHVIALIASLRAPHSYLVVNRAALEERVRMYVGLLATDGVIDRDFAAAVIAAPLEFLPHAPVAPRPDFIDRKAITAVRTLLLDLLGLESLYDLDRLHLEVDSTIEADLQDNGIEILESLGRPEFVKANGLTAERLLEHADPSKVIYSVLLFERARQGNLVRMQVDNLDQPFDINNGVKVELGSTAKLRTLAHYLEVVTLLFHELAPLPTEELSERARNGSDPITQWVAETLQQSRLIELEPLLQAALQRRYSSGQGESFFTGGGMHSFVNFDPKKSGPRMTVLEGFKQSINLVFIRLMRDLVRYHRARLPYDTEAVLEGRSDARAVLLDEIAEEEGKDTLRRAYRRYRDLDAPAIIRELLGRKAKSPRYLTMLFYAWKQGQTEDDLAAWLTAHLGEEIDRRKVQALMRSYGNPDLTIPDFGYLVGRNSLDLWCAGALAQQPTMSWEDLVERSAEARRLTSAWLFKPSNRAAQNYRLRNRFERDAFARMTPYWQRLGFPFAHLTPSYATAIGSASDRPAALADLMGIIVNDGLRRPSLVLRRLRFAAGTPYETVFEPAVTDTERVMEPAVARVLRSALRQVVEGGTARRIAGAFRHAGGDKAVVGGKTGTGDNRFTTFYRGGGVRSSRAVNRTATFAFYIDDRYFGVITAFVGGREADRYSYTSALPVSVLKLFSPAINTRLATAPAQVPEEAPAPNELGPAGVPAQNVDAPAAPPQPAAQISAVPSAEPEIAEF